MAANAKGIYGCSCRLFRIFPRYQLRTTRYFAAQADKKLEEHEDSKQNSRQKKKRDPLAVLKALSSTVKKVPGSPDVGFFEDAYLTPRSDYTRREYLAALESGRDAAEFVIKKYPDLFKLREPVPAWPDEYTTFEELEDEETLNYLIKTDNVENAVSLYEVLKQKGEKLSLHSMNAFLDLVAFHGIGMQNTIAQSSNASIWHCFHILFQLEKVDSSSSSSDSDSSSDEEGQAIDASSDKSGTGTYGFKTRKLLSENSLAATLFTNMDDKNAETYEAFILGLLKHGEFDSACKYLGEMRSNGHKASTFLYNQFLRNVISNDEVGDTRAKWNLAQEFVEKIKDDATVIPDIVTYNALLDLASKLENEAPLKTGMIMREILASGLEPSLGSYLYVLESHGSRKWEKYGLLQEIVNSVEKQKGPLAIRDLKDTEFFSVAMNLARSFGDADIAKRLFALIKNGGNFGLLAKTTSAFLGNYICALARAEKNIDLVFEEYDRLVPNEVVPRDWVFAELFRRLEKGEKPERITKLCKDMKNNRVRLAYPVCERIFLAFGSKMPTEMHKDCLETALDMMRWMAMFDIPMTSLVLGQIARLYALNGLFEDAWKTILLFEEKNLTPR
eukprot:gene5421-6099_t